MLPLLFDLKIIKIYTLGVFLVLAFFWSAYWLWRNIKLTSYKEEDVFDGLFISLFGGIFFSRLVFVILNFKDFGFNFLKFILINGFPGLSLIGALIGGLGTFYLYMRLKKAAFFDMIDYVISPLFLALAIGKIGSFLGGTDVGTTTSFIIKVPYVGYEGARHVTALYEAGLFFIAFYVSHKLIFMVRRHRLPAGATLYFFMAYFSCVQLLLDNLKQNHLYFAGLSFNMIVTGIFFLVGISYFIITQRQHIVKVSQQYTSKIKLYGRQSNKTTTGKISKEADSRGEQTSQDN